MTVADGETSRRRSVEVICPDTGKKAEYLPEWGESHLGQAGSGPSTGDEIVRYIACVSPDLSCALRFFGTAVIGLWPATRAPRSAASNRRFASSWS
jgi:hypothetical protein